MFQYDTIVEYLTDVWTAKHLGQTMSYVERNVQVEDELEIVSM